MSYRYPTGRTSNIRVTHISTDGIWLLAYDRKRFLSYDDFPYFRDQTVKTIIRVEEPSPGHYYWPELDIDLTEESIEHPMRFTK